MSTPPIPTRNMYMDKTLIAIGPYENVKNTIDDIIETMGLLYDTHPKIYILNAKNGYAMTRYPL